MLESGICGVANEIFMKTVLFAEAEKYYDRAEELSTGMPYYSSFLERFFLLEKFGDGDFNELTYEKIFDSDKKVEAGVYSRENGLLSGVEEVSWFVNKFFNQVAIDFKFLDGEPIHKEDLICHLSGSLKEILMLERIMLNVLQRMSGISTNTNKIAQSVQNILIAGTRKTLWGPIDKKAISKGGGLTHRLSLADRVLVKDSHLDALCRDFEQVFKKLENVKDFFVIEVLNREECLKTAYWAAIKKRKIGILLDNMAALVCAKIDQDLCQKNLREFVILEASGGITEKNISDYDNSGVDIVSMGCLTQKSIGLDLSLKILN